MTNQSTIVDSSSNSVSTEVSADTLHYGYLTSKGSYRIPMKNLTVMLCPQRTFKRADGTKTTVTLPDNYYVIYGFAGKDTLFENTFLGGTYHKVAEGEKVVLMSGGNDEVTRFTIESVSDTGLMIRIKGGAQ